jgi:hypothetical protein
MNQINKEIIIKSVKKGFVLGILLLMLYYCFLTPSFIFTSDFPCIRWIPFDKENVDRQAQFIKIRYSSEIFPMGNEIISKELEITKKIQDPDKRLDEIFRWEMLDWHNPNWEHGSFYFENNSPLYMSYNHDFTKLRAAPEYYYNLYGQRNPNGTFFGNDPYWIAYHKVGACRELSNLFAFMAYKSGIESRTVQTIFDHQWVEVKINGKWKYYDPWCAVEHGYYNATDGNLTFKDKWYNYPSYFRDNCHGLAYVNFYNEIIPNPLATQDYSLSYIEYDIKNFVLDYRVIEKT